MRLVSPVNRIAITKIAMRKTYLYYPESEAVLPSSSFHPSVKKAVVEVFCRNVLLILTFHSTFLRIKTTSLLFNGGAAQ